MYAGPSPFKEIKTFEWKDLHKKIGQIFVAEPTESDISEGNFMAKVWFTNDKVKLWLLDEWDIRDKSGKGE